MGQSEPVQPHGKFPLCRRWVRGMPHLPPHPCLAHGGGAKDLNVQNQLKMSNSLETKYHVSVRWRWTEPEEDYRDKTGNDSSWQSESVVHQTRRAAPVRRQEGQSPFSENLPFAGWDKKCLSFFTPGVCSWWSDPTHGEGTDTKWR